MTEMLIVCPGCKRPKGESHFHTRRRSGVYWRDSCLGCQQGQRERQSARRAKAYTPKMATTERLDTSNDHKENNGNQARRIH